ncbi:hypothetical protein LEMLEM_LOCUS8778 [Lemmus lemmus]
MSTEKHKETENVRALYWLLSFMCKIPTTSIVLQVTTVQKMSVQRPLDGLP